MGFPGCFSPLKVELWDPIYEENGGKGGMVP